MFRKFLRSVLWGRIQHKSELFALMSIIWGVPASLLIYLFLYFNLFWLTIPLFIFIGLGWLVALTAEPFEYQENPQYDPTIQRMQRAIEYSKKKLKELVND